MVMQLSMIVVFKFILKKRMFVSRQTQNEICYKVIINPGKPITYTMICTTVLQDVYSVMSLSSLAVILSITQSMLKFELILESLSELKYNMLFHVLVCYSC